MEEVSLITLAIIVALSIEQFWSGVQGWRQLVWGYQFPYKPELVAIVILLLVSLIYDATAYFSPSLAVLFSVLVLLFSLGPTLLKDEVSAILVAWWQDDYETATSLMQQLLSADDSEVAELEEQEFFTTLAVAVISETSQRTFNVIFWFVILGPLGAVIVRLKGMALLSSVLNWLPTRIATWSYALVGDFSKSRDAILSANNLQWQESEKLLYTVGVAAIGKEPEQIDKHDIESLQQLNWRVVVLWVVVMAVIELL